jgi:hypothetical protein
MPVEDPAHGYLKGHRRILGVCWFVYGIVRLIMGICLVLSSGTATLMFGALLSRVPDPFVLMGDFHFIYLGILILTFLSGFCGILAGWSLLANQHSARVLALVAAFLSVSEIPFGTTLGIYTLVVLLPRGEVSLSRSVQSNS